MKRIVSFSFIFVTFVISSVVLLYPLPAFAGTFYVRPDGNDLNTGTENSPQGAFRTIQKAANIINPSDTVEVQAGTYTELVTITRSGLSNQYITFKANGEVIIDGQNTRAYCIKLNGADYIKIEGFIIRSATDNGILLDNAANYNIISNNTFYNNGASGIRLNNSSTYNTIKNNTCYSNGYGTSAYGDRPCGIYLFNSSNYNTLDSNICRNNSSTGIWLEGSSSYCTIKNNKTYSNSYGGIIIVGGTNYNTVSYNLIYSNGQMGVDLSYSAHDNVFKNNTIYNNGTNGIQSNNNGYSNILKNNIIVNNGLNNSWAYGITMDAGCSAISTYNNLYNNGQGGNRNYYGLSIGPGDISLEPIFKSTDPNSPDFLKLKSLANGDLVESPCIDSGDPNDTPSPQSGKRIDIGAYDLYSHSPIQGGLLAEYYDNQNLTSLKLVRIDPRINFDWGDYTPDASLGVDTYSVRWRGQIKIDFAQNYTFYITTDDGSRLWIDNQLIIDKWFGQAPTEYSATIYLTPGLHDIKYEYYENVGWAVAKLYWSSPSINKSLIPSDHLYYFDRLPQGQYIQGGLKGEYYKFSSLYGFPSYVFTRIDPQINFDWGTNSPDYSTGWDTYSAKWKGKLKIDRAETYTFYTISDDGVRLWINNQLLIYPWNDHGATEHQASISLTPGLYDIELNYYENGSKAVCKLLWSSSTIAKSPIPATNLYYDKDNYSEGGLYAEYFDNKDLTSPKIKRIDPKIDYDWKSFSPDSLIQCDTYSIRWTGQVKADYDETYTFYISSDDGARLYIDNNLIINTWFDKWSYETSANTYLTQGWHDIKIEYYDNDSLAAMKLAYSSPSTPKTIIPQDHLRTTLSAEEASLTLYCSLNSPQDIQTPIMGHSGTIIQNGTGAVTFEWAKFSKGALLNGTSDGNNDELISFSSFDLNKKEGLIEFWFKPNWNSDDGIWHHIFSTAWSWNGTIELFKYTNNSIYFRIIKDGVQHGIVSNTTRKWNANEWHHLAFSYGPAGMKFYLDYNEIPISWTFHSETPYAGTLPDNFTSDVYLGGANWGGAPSDCVFDELKIYNKQLIPSDTKAPIIAITSHQDNQIVNSSPVTIVGTIDDNLATVTVAGIVPPATVLNGTFTTPPIPLALGPNTITVVATDQSLNSSSKSITLIYVDITPPATPTVNPVVSHTNISTQLLSGTKEANSSIWINGSQAVPLDSLTVWSKIVNLSEGTNNFSITSKDTSNNESGAVIVTIFLDTTLPTGTIMINNNAQYTKSRDVILTLSATDTGTGVSKMQFSNDGTNYSDPEPYDITKPWDLSAGDGEKTVYAKFKDVAGNWSSPISDKIILDTTAPSQPTIDTLTSPTHINSQTVTGTKSTDTTSIMVTCPTATVGEVTYPTSTTWSCQLTNLTEGNNDITVTAKDAAGNESTSASWTIVLDTIAPAQPTIDPVTSPTNMNYQTITGTKSTDSTSIIVVCPTATVGEVTYPTSTTWSCQLTNLTEGNNDITVTAQDAAGNPSIPNSTTITYQPTTGLTVKITSHENNARVNTSTITVSGTVSNSTATVTVNNIPAEVIGNTFTAPNIPLTEGTNIITARATKDTETAEDTINVILDLDPPSITIFTPDDNSTTRSNIVYGRVSDDTASVIARSGSNEAISAELLSDFRFIARPTLQEGANTITVQAQDKAGNTNQASINITYNTTSPKVTITLPLDNSTQDISPIKVEGTNTEDLQFILVNSATALIGTTNFTAEGITLDTTKTVITASGYDANNSIFQDSIVINSPNLAHYELTKISGDVTEDDPDRPAAGGTTTLTVKLQKNNLAAPNEEIQFQVSQGQGTLSYNSIFTDINGQAQVTLTTDTNSDITNQIEAYPTNNPLVKTTFYVDTKPAQPAILTKITDDSITPVPGATIPLIVKLTDSNNNPIQDETINFQVISGDGTLSSSTATTTYYGEAKTNLACPDIGLVLTQVKASSNTNPSVNVTFNITTSAPLSVTIDDIINKVNQNDSKIQDMKADITVTSNAPFLPSTMQLKIWQKGDKQKVEEVSPTPQVKIRPISNQILQMNREIILCDSLTNIYVIKSKLIGQIDEYPYDLDYVDYQRGVIVKTERYFKVQQDLENLYVIEYLDFLQFNDIWGFQKIKETMYDGNLKEEYYIIKEYSNIQINAGIPDTEFD